MHSLNRTGLRVAAAGAAAALTLAAAAPAFAQNDDDEIVTDDETTTEEIVDDEITDETGTGDDAPAEDDEIVTDDETTTDEETEGEDVEDEADPIAEDEFELEDSFEYEFAFLNHVLLGANPGETLTGHPEIRVNSESSMADERAATVLWFEDSSDVYAWFEEGELVWTEAVAVIADYDNCQKDDHFVYCVLPEFDPEVGTTYTPSEETPVLFEVLQAVTEADGAAYGGYDIDQAGLEEAEAAGMVFEGDNQLTLVESNEGISDEYFSEYWGWIFFEGDERGWGNVPPSEGELPKTGTSSTIMISAAAAALAAGAGVFMYLRRRKTAQNWE
ncbi:LPXTG cell wall anchor domain-containing protein [Glycomyces buryatensis]|uniref:LPXTG cell wall anchor domain-containing protein n=1 Tax=Glycomyces buryatensis TaxID=2570927 RepID=A0A4S8QBN2_9ACTN|nr:LPXTG cell wall anchor domain-containing protein [Glycomyces buryatensis]THV40951.1 LPXTG cell wall anchor domain-containing protein [Glycomyces buryatensis]